MQMYSVNEYYIIKIKTMRNPAPTTTNENMKKLTPKKKS